MNSQVHSVLIAVESPFGVYDAERFDLERLDGMTNLAVLDMTPLIKPHFWAQFGDRTIRHPAVRIIESWTEAYQLVSGHTWDAWIDELGVSRVSNRLRKIMRKSGSARVRIRLGLLPGDFVIQTNVKARLLARRSQLGLFRLAKSVILFVPRRLVRRIPPPDLVLGSGSYTIKDVAAGSPIIWAHSFDYEKAKNEELRDESPERMAAVFLDQNLGYHPDQLHSGLRSPVDADTYYAALLETFRRIEVLRGRPTTIAVHPKSSFDDPIMVFGDRPTKRSITPRLIRGADLVLCHASASLSYAVIWRRPVLFMTSDELERCDYKVHIDEMARILRRPIINIDHIDAMSDDDLQTLMNVPVDESAYLSYEEGFIRSSKSNEGHLWEIFVRGLEGFLAERRRSTEK